MQQKVRVFISCCNRLLGQSVAHILTKRSDFRVISGLPTEAEIGEDGSRGTIVLDSLQALALYRGQPSRRAGEAQTYHTVLIAMEDSREHFLRAIRNGVSGYVLQDASAMDVISAIRAVSQGEAACPARMTRTLFDYVARLSARGRTAHAASEKSLTRREQDIVPLIGNGLTNKEIAARLNLSEETIKSHIHRILRKVGVEDRHAVFEACQSGLEV